MWGVEEGRKDDFLLSGDIMDELFFFVLLLFSKLRTVFEFSHWPFSTDSTQQTGYAWGSPLCLFQRSLKPLKIERGEGGQWGLTTAASGDFTIKEACSGCLPEPAHTWPTHLCNWVSAWAWADP